MGVNIETIFDLCDLEETPAYKDRIKEALDIAWRYGCVDGEHHKMWTINQIVKVLCGGEDNYNKWIHEYEKPLPDGDRYIWDYGIAP